MKGNYYNYGLVLIQLYHYLQVVHEKAKKQESLKESFLQILAEQLPHLPTFDEKAINNVYNVLVQKLCNTRIQE